MHHSVGVPTVYSYRTLIGTVVVELVLALVLEQVSLVVGLVLVLEVEGLIQEYM
jgi:hypothetical protein